MGFCNAHPHHPPMSAAQGLQFTHPLPPPPPDVVPLPEAEAAWLPPQLGVPWVPRPLVRAVGSGAQHSSER